MMLLLSNSLYVLVRAVLLSRYGVYDIVCGIVQGVTGDSLGKISPHELSMHRTFTLHMHVLFLSQCSVTLD